MAVSRAKRFAWVGLVRRGVVTLLETAAAVIVLGTRYQLFHLSKELVFWVAATAIVVSALDGVLRIIARGRDLGRADAPGRVQMAVTAALSALAAEHQVNMRYLGASVFHLRRRYRPKQRWWGLTRCPVRVLRWRLQNDPQPTRVAWVRGKGAVGEAWAKGRVIHRDWREQLEHHSDSSLSYADFARLPAKVRDGFEHDEFVRISPKYRETLAVPIVSEAGDIVGVLSADVSAKAGLDRLVLDGPDVEDSMLSAAKLIYEDIHRLYAQD